MKTQRNLDVVYFRICRDGELVKVCYSDLDQTERDEIASKLAENKDIEYQAAFWRMMADIMANALYDVGEQFGIVMQR